MIRKEDIKDSEYSYNVLIYVYNVTDREAFDNFEKTQEILKKKFNESHKDIFVLYAIDTDCVGKRAVSLEEQAMTALRYECSYFELTYFGMTLHEQMDKFYTFNGGTYYITGSKEADVDRLVYDYTRNKFREYKPLSCVIIPKKIEEMEPLEDILDNAKKSIGIYFVYSPASKESFTVIEEYFSKSISLQNYLYYSVFIVENYMTMDKDKRRVISAHEVNKFCLKKGISFKSKIDYGNENSSSCVYPHRREKNEIKIRWNNPLEKYSNVTKDDCNSCTIRGDFGERKSLKIERGYDVVDIHIHDPSAKSYNLGVSYNYISACDFKGYEKKEMIYYEKRTLDPEERQHYLRITGNEIESVINQYFEIQNPVIETIHIFCNEKCRYGLLFNKVVGFINEEECKLISFQGHIYKFNVEFHDRYSFDSQMKYIICFVDFYDDDEIKDIVKEIQAKYLIGTECRISLCAMKTMDISPEFERARVHKLKELYSRYFSVIEKVCIPSFCETSLVFGDKTKRKKFVEGMDEPFLRLITGYGISYIDDNDNDVEVKKEADTGHSCRV